MVRGPGNRSGRSAPATARSHASGRPAARAVATIVTTLAVLVPALAARAQSGGGYTIVSHAIGSGGTASQSPFASSATIGETGAGGSASGGGFVMAVGFWPAVAASPGEPTPSPTPSIPGAATPTSTTSGSVAGTPTATIGGVGGATPTATASATAVATAHVPSPTAAATPTVTEKTVRACRVAIVKSAAALAETKLAALQQCETKVLAGKMTGICPDADPKTTQKIAAAEDKARAAIAKACGGKNKTCSASDLGADADVPLADIGFPTVCPGFAGGCTDAIVDCGDIAGCLGCIAEEAVDQTIGLDYDLTPADPKAAKAMNACQQTVGKGAAKLFDARAKVLEHCWSDVVDGKSALPCPDAAKAEPALVKATTQFAATVAKACCGKNKACNATDTGQDADFDPVTQLGFPSKCRDVSIPGGASCGGTITDTSSLIGCLACVAEFETDCVSIAPVPPSIAPYAAECE